jgi:uncharacterized phage-associated protein
MKLGKIVGKTIRKGIRKANDIVDFVESPSTQKRLAQVETAINKTKDNVSRLAARVEDKIGKTTTNLSVPAKPVERAQNAEKPTNMKDFNDLFGDLFNPGGTFDSIFGNSGTTKKSSIPPRKTRKIQPEDVACRFLKMFQDNGETVTAKKLQHIVWYSYVWTFAIMNKKLFEEQWEARRDGPAVASLYDNLIKVRGAVPKDFFTIDIPIKFPDKVESIFDEVYERYSDMSPMDIQNQVKSEKPWKAARAGIDIGDSRRVLIEEAHIKETYVPVQDS